MRLAKWAKARAAVFCSGGCGGLWGWGCLTLVVILGLLAYGSRERIAWQLKPWDDRPSYVVIVLDDLDWDLVADDWLAGEVAGVGAASAATGDGNGIEPGGLAGVGRFPVMREMARQGLVFTNFHSTTPVCGPARACLLSGQYASRHGVRVNRPDHPTSNGFSGGVQQYGRRLDWTTLWQRSGYETGFVGKYVHDGFTPDPNVGVEWSDLLPSGWDHFHASLGARYSEFWVMDRRQLQTVAVPGRHRTAYEADVVIEQLAEREGSKQSQLICWFPLAPHDSTHNTLSYPPEMADGFDDAEPPAWGRKTGAAGLELPQTLQRALPLELTAEQRAMTARVWRERLRSIAGFDRELGRIRESLRTTGRLENTVFVITSDHGFRLGDHGHVGKRLPYDRITRVPLLISGPGVRAGVCNDLLGNIDLAPTLLDCSGGLKAEDQQRFDGRSFARCLNAAEGTYEPIRQELLLQSWESENVWGQRIPSVWTTLRTEGEAYTEWADGEREYYDLRRDPEQWDNRYEALTSAEVEVWQTRLRGQTAALETAPLLSVPVEPWERLVKFPQNPAFKPISLQGFVEAGEGVETVEVAVRDSRSGRYWSGDDWRDELVFVPCTLHNPGGVLSGWTFDWRTGPGTWAEPEIELESGERRVATAVERRQWSVEMELTVRATDRRGATSVWESPTPLPVRPFDPETWLNELPLAEWTGDQPLELTGQAIGCAPIKHVRVIVQDKVTRLYWDGQAWGETLIQNECQVVAEEDGMARWSYRFDGRSRNRLYFAARAVDSQNYYDRSVAYFELKGIDEAVQLTTAADELGAEGTSRPQ